MSSRPRSSSSTSTTRRSSKVAATRPTRAVPSSLRWTTARRSSSLSATNTSVSKEIYKYVAGYEQPAGRRGRSSAGHGPGVYDLFSNYDPRVAPAASETAHAAHRQRRDRKLRSNRRRVSCASSLARSNCFKTRLCPPPTGRARAEQITEAQILREVVNTVGKRNALGSHNPLRRLRLHAHGRLGREHRHPTLLACARSASQLLCEQVAGRALRRKKLLPSKATTRRASPRPTSAKIANYKFPPEYAHIIGVPFKLFKGGKNRHAPRRWTRSVSIHCAKRTERCEITFANVEGYRIDYPRWPADLQLQRHRRLRS